MFPHSETSCPSPQGGNTTALTRTKMAAPERARWTEGRGARAGTQKKAKPVVKPHIWLALSLRRTEAEEAVLSMSVTPAEGRWPPASLVSVQHLIPSHLPSPHPAAFSLAQAPLNSVLMPLAPAYPFPWRVLMLCFLSLS